ncbi:hypothetical protein FHS24_001064 [Psychrobacter luti]|uniref:Type IV secretion protein Rhs n=1 Tax=Psychrobacter luti TaxID=198481 RepID=A0A839TG79_9GAMM|nr:type IV secretion protein Rhs [Psychrobacter luti]MBB3106563.1 hypothetical protein [Psychrobacter luti]
MRLQSTFKRLFKHSIAAKGSKQQSRQLTEGEIALARSVFGDCLKLDDVQLKTAWWVLKHYAVSPNGNIYFHPVDWVKDFSQCSLGKQSWLIHELTHVWQLQQGLKVVRGAIMNRRYEYVFEAGKSFFNYGIEQQARMVQDYFVRRHHGHDCRDFETCVPFLKEQMLNSNHDTRDSYSSFKV